MHEIAATVGSSSIILIGLIFGILYNQCALDRLEARMDGRMDSLEGRLDKIQTDLNAFYRSLGQHDKAIEILEKRAG